MFFVLSKVLSFFFNPLVWVVGLLAWGLLSKNRARKRRLLIGAFALLVITTNPFVVNEVVQWWEVPSYSAEEIRGQYDYGIVPGGVLTYYNTNARRGSFGPATDRLMQAVDLYHRKKVRRLVITGGSGRLQYQDYKEADALKEILTGMGIPTGDILTESRSRNTYENATFTAQLIQGQPGGKRCVLITSAWHMRRAQGCFVKAGIDITPFPANALSGTRGFTPDRLLIPNAESLLLWQMLAHEWAGTAIYRVAGYL